MVLEGAALEGSCQLGTQSLGAQQLQQLVCSILQLLVEKLEHVQPLTNKLQATLYMLQQSFAAELIQACPAAADGRQVQQPVCHSICDARQRQIFVAA